MKNTAGYNLKVKPSNIYSKIKKIKFIQMIVLAKRIFLHS